MKSKLLGLVLVGGLFAVGCKVSVVDDGVGGTGSTSSSTKASSSSTKAATTTGGMTTTTGMQVDCSTLPCSDMDMDNTNDCLSCSQTIGACVSENETCGANAECGAFLDCLNACPDDDPATMADENLDCVCANDGTTCTNLTTAGTCTGDHQGGIQDYIALADCVLGDGMGTDGECTTACPQ